MTHDQKLQYGTCRIESRFASGRGVIGTGFYYAYRVDDARAVPMIVTNRHVIWDSVEGPAVGGRFQVHTSRIEQGHDVPTGDFLSLNFASSDFPFHMLWRAHEDPTVDLCAMPAASLRHAMKAGFDSAPFIVALGDDFGLTPEQLAQLNVVEDVLMVGYPTGLWDDAHNFPLFRTGSTATHPAVDFQGRPEFVVDLACFPGSSGSPVFAMRSNGYPWEETPRDPRRFLGVLYAGPLLPGTQSTINLGYVIKASKVNELVAQVWSHWKEVGFIPSPWSSSWDRSLLPRGAQLPDEQGVFHDVEPLSLDDCGGDGPTAAGLTSAST